MKPFQPYQQPSKQVTNEEFSLNLRPAQIFRVFLRIIPAAFRRHGPQVLTDVLAARLNSGNLRALRQTCSNLRTWPVKITRTYLRRVLQIAKTRPAECSQAYMHQGENVAREEPAK